MSTVADIIKNVKYDLRNFGQLDFDETQVIHYLNRCVKILDQKFIQFNSDQTLTQGNVTLTAGNNYIDCPARTLAVREIWIGQDRKQAIDQEELYYRRRFRTSDTAEPNYWAHVKDDVEFEVTAADNATVVMIYDAGTAPFTATTDTMPYAGLYDQSISEIIVNMLVNKKYKDGNQLDAGYMTLFDTIANHDMVNRKFARKQYTLDF